MTPVDQLFVAALIVGGGVLAIAALVGTLSHAFLDVSGGGHHGDAAADAGAADAGSVHADASGAHADAGDAGAHPADAGDTGTAHGAGFEMPGLGTLALCYLSPVALAMTVAYFGLLGLGLRALGIGAVLAIVLAIPGGLALSRGTAKLVGRVLASGSHSSHEMVARMVGRIADVTTTIPERGFGQVTVFAAGARTSYPARADRSLPVGSRVMIERIENGVAYVTLYDEGTGPGLLE